MRANKKLVAGLWFVTLSTIFPATNYNHNCTHHTPYNITRDTQSGTDLHIITHTQS